MTFAIVLLTTRLAKVRKKNKSYNTDKLLKHDCKTKFQKTIRNEAAYQMLRMLTKAWGSGNGENTTDTDKPTQINTQKTLHRKGRVFLLGWGYLYFNYFRPIQQFLSGLVVSGCRVVAI